MIGLDAASPLAIIYASTSGNVEAVMEKIAQVLSDHGFDSHLYRAETLPVAELGSHHQFIFGTSTWEHGELNPYFQPLLAEMKKMNFADKQAGFVGLGDTRYEPVLFCKGIEIVRETWLKQAGQEIGTTLKINGEPYHVLDTVVTEWAKKIIATAL